MTDKSDKPRDRMGNMEKLKALSQFFSKVAGKTGNIFEDCKDALVRSTLTESPMLNSDDLCTPGAGEEIIDEFGYENIYSPEHPFADEDGMCLHHRTVVEMCMRYFTPESPYLIQVPGYPGVYLDPRVPVIHMDGNKRNNGIENLRLLTTGDLPAINKSWKHKRPIEIKIKREPGYFALPTKSYTTDAGYDVMAADDRILQPGVVAKLCLGFSMELPKGYEAQIRPRSSMGKAGITMPNSPGTIDADYRGEVCVLLLNTTATDIQIFRGQRIAQMVIKEVPTTRLVEVDRLSVTARGTGGFGSTGVK